MQFNNMQFKNENDMWLICKRKFECIYLKPKATWLIFIKIMSRETLPHYVHSH